MGKRVGTAVIGTMAGAVVAICALVFLDGDAHAAQLFAPVGTSSEPTTLRHARVMRHVPAPNHKQLVQGQGVVGPVYDSTVIGSHGKLHFQTRATTVSEPQFQQSWSTMLFFLGTAASAALISHTYTWARRLGKTVFVSPGQAALEEVVSQHASVAPTGNEVPHQTAMAMATTSGKADTPKAQVALSGTEDVALGALSGVIQILCIMPVLTWKFCSQTGQPYPMELAGWYRGVAVQAGSVAPITALQFLCNGAIGKMLSGASPLSSELKRELTSFERLLAGLGAGIVSACIYTPVDLLTVQQQKMGLSLMGAVQYIVSEAGPEQLWRGILATSAREGIFAAGMFGLTPIISEILAKNLPRFKKNVVMANIMSACAAGVTAALLTHPMDTIKSCLQSDLFGTTYNNIVRTMTLIVKNSGWGGLFQGFVPRTILVIVAFFITTTLQQAYLGFKTRRALADTDTPATV